MTIYRASIVLDPREPDPFDTRCYGCFQEQPDATDAYATCGECGHVFVTEADLIRLDREWWEHMDLPDPEARSGADIATCPCCTHDF